MLGLLKQLLRQEQRKVRLSKPNKHIVSIIVVSLHNFWWLILQILKIHFKSGVFEDIFTYSFSSVDSRDVPTEDETKYILKRD